MPRSDPLMPRVNQAVALVGAAAVAWLSQASLALADAGAGIDRLALLPLSRSAIVLCLLAGVLASLAVRRGFPLVALAPLLLCLLPWLPVSVPPAFLLWSGPLAALPWIAVGAAVLAMYVPRRGSRFEARGDAARPGTASARVGTGTREPNGASPEPGNRGTAAIAGIVAALGFGVAAWLTAPTRPGGDEPHYLVITQSLLNDRDLRIENNHQRGEYREYFAGELRPDFRTRGIDGQIYSIHAPGLPALVAPAFAVAGYRGVVALLILLSGAGSALAWQLAWLYTRRADAAWFGWAAVTFGATSVFHAFSIYPDGTGGVIVATGAWALLKAADGVPRPTRTWVLHGAALALLPWLHSRFAFLAGTLGALILLRLWSGADRVRHSLAFLAVPVASCAAWLAYFVVIYGVPSPSAPYAGERGSAGFIADGLVGLFFDQRFGLFVYAPVLGFAIAGLAAMRNRLAVELLIVIVPYLLIVTTFRMWWAGWSAPARFAVPLLPLFAVPAAAAWSAMRSRGTRATAAGALILTTAITAVVVAVEGGRLAYNTRTEPSLLLRWLTRAADLPRALPAWSLDEMKLYVDVATWCAAAILGWAIARSVDGVVKSRPVCAAALAGTFAIGAMAAASTAWRAGGVDGTTPLPGQLALLRDATDDRALFAGLLPPRRIRRDDLPGQLRLRLEPLAAEDGPGLEAAVLFVVPGIPAGEYHLRPRARGAGGTLSIAVGRDSTPVYALAAIATEAFVLRLPVDLRGLVIRGDGDARRAVRGLTIEPVSLVPASSRLSATPATRGARYGHTVVYFLDDRSFPEPDAFWVGGSRDSTIVLCPDAARPAATLLVRNAPVENRVGFETAGWRDELHLAPGEERRIEVPLDPAHRAARVRVSVSSGFRPSEVDPTSLDQRFLGAWIKVL